MLLNVSLTKIHKLPAVVTIATVQFSIARYIYKT